MTCPTSKPVFIILGGPNGAGKTTGALSILPQELRIVHFVNADLIARGLSPLDPTLANYAEIGYITTSALQFCSAMRCNFRLPGTVFFKL